jgi:hypothetical protein
MLQRVSVGQSRFNVPGLSADGRGAVLGRQWLGRFGAIDRLVSFLRIWSAEQALDDVHPGLRIVQVRREGGSREVLLSFPVASVAVADSAARATRIAGGECFTGTGKQFVQYRDGHAPLGYDVTALEPTSGADFVLYSSDQTTSHLVVADLPLDKLLLRLELQRDRTPIAALQVTRLFLRVRRGLGPILLEYLYRVQRYDSDLVAAATLCEQDASSRFDRATRFWLFRLEGLPSRLRQVLSDTPGMTLMVPVADHILVAAGYRHPIHLGGCRAQFPADKMYLFAPQPLGVTSVSPAPVLVAIAELVRLEGGVASLDKPVPAPTPARSVDKKEWVVPIRLEAVPIGDGRIVATLIPWAQAGWLRALCYALPPSALHGHRMAILERGLLVVAPDTLFGFPFGQLFHSPAPGLLVPLGLNLRPAIPPQLLAAQMGAPKDAPSGERSGEDAGARPERAGALTVFASAAEPPFRVPAEALLPLEARVLADPRLRRIFTDAGIFPDPIAAADPLADIEIDNQAVGLLPLWRIGHPASPGKARKKSDV